MKEYFDFIAKPKIAWLTVNRDCNFSCPWCYGQCVPAEKSAAMDFDLSKKLIHIITNLGIKKVILIGGEPTLYDELPRINSICRAAGISTTVVTNCSRFSDDDYWCRYLESPCDNISISIKSVEEKEFSRISGGMSLSQGLLGIKRAIDYYRTGVSTVLNNAVGVDGLLEIAKVSNDLGASYLTISPCAGYITDDSFNKGGAFELKEFADIVCGIYPKLEESFAGNVHLSMRLPLCIFPVDFIEKLRTKNDVPFVCQLHERNGIVFDTNGDVLLCNDIHDGTIAKYGTDFTDAKDLLSTLNSDDMRDNFRKLLRYPSAECDDCSWNTLCRGGCLMTWFANNPSICRAVHCP